MRTALAVLLFALAATPAKGDWGTVQGTVVWGEKELPKGEVVPKVRLPIFAYRVDPRTRGVAEVMVWLVREDKGRGPLPIHPALAVPAPRVVMDQSGDEFEPRVLGIREGQALLVKNSTGRPSNASIIGGKTGVNVHPLIPPGKEQEYKGWKAAPTPASVTCSIHPWMKAYIRVFDHPYFAVTDKDGKFEMKNAPAGKYRLVVWHPESGWVTGDGKEPDRFGKTIAIRGGAVTKLPVIDLKLPRD